MNMLREGNPWDIGGPTVFHSPWWLRAHWGRAFDVLDVWPYMAVERERACIGLPLPARRPTPDDPPVGHGMILLRRKPVQLTIDDLLRLEPGDPREILALQHNVWQLRDDAAELRRQNAQLTAQVDVRREEIAGLKQELDARDRQLRDAEEALLRQRAWLERIQKSTSWRLTAPGRAAKHRLKSLPTTKRSPTTR